MAEVQLKQNWAGYPPGKIVSVSQERGAYLVDFLKVGRYTKEQLERDKSELGQNKPAAGKPKAPGGKKK